MRKYLILLTVLTQVCLMNQIWSQQDPAAVNCSGAVPGCNLPSFYISTDNSQNIQDFTTGTVSNPSTNPNPVPGNSGCLLSGETTSTFITIDIISSGTLEWSIQAAQTACLDWIMWPNTPTICQDLPAAAQAPVACNWNGSCGGFTGMAAPGNLPAGASQSDFEYALNVVAGESYLLCLSNYSGISAPVNFSFFGSAGVSCTPGTPDQTICLGQSATVDIVVSAVLTNPTYTWLVTTGVSDPNSGTGVIVTPTVTTEYIVEIDDPGLTTPIQDTFLITVEAPPQPYAGVDQSICLGDVIQLAGVPEDPANNNVLWQSDVSNVSPPPSVNFVPNFSDPNAQVSVNQVGTYYFILRESNALCGNQYDTMEVVVSELDITASAVAPTCQGYADGEIHITSLDAIEYSFDGGTTWVADSFDVVFNAGTYNVCGRTVTGCQKCVSVDVMDPAPVTISVSNDTLICQNGTAYMSASATGGNTYLFHWDHTSNTTATQNVNPLTQTIYTVYAENESGCISPNESITVSVRQPISGTITPFDTICPGYPTSVTATSAGGIGTPYHFSWSSGETHDGSGMHTITANPPSTQDYTVTITDECESTPLVLTTNIRVAPLPEPEYQVLNPIQCEPAIFDIVNVTDSSMSQFVYWQVDGIHQYLNQDTITTPEFWHGDYEIYMMVTSYEGCVDSIRVENALFVQPKPVANFGYTPNPVTAFNTTVSFSNYSFNGYTYQWYFENGYPSSSTQEDVQVEFPDGVVDRYNVMLITTSELGCVDTMLHELVVQPEILIYAPNSFTPDGDEFNQDWQIYMEGVDIYDWELLIFDRWGEIIWESHDISVPWDGIYKGKLLPEGTYVWTIRTRDVLTDEKIEFRGHVNILK